MGRVEIPHETCEQCGACALVVETMVPRCEEWDASLDPGECCGHAWHAGDGDVVSCEGCGAKAVIVADDTDAWIAWPETEEDKHE